MPVLLLLFTCSLVSCFILTVIRLYGSVIFPRIRSVVEISAWILVCINCRTPTTVREIQDTYNSKRDTGHLQQRERYRTTTTAREIQDTYNSERDTGHLQQRERYRTPTTAREIQSGHRSFYCSTALRMFDSWQKRRSWSAPRVCHTVTSSHRALQSVRNKERITVRLVHSCTRIEKHRVLSLVLTTLKHFRLPIYSPNH